MKSHLIITLAGLLAISVPASSQTFTPFGQLSIAEMDMTECSFDKEADAVILLHEANTNYDVDYNMVTDHHIRIKILKEKGISHADISIPFYRKDGFEQVVVTKASTFSLSDRNATEMAVERKSIFTKKSNEFYGETVFTFPGVKAGSILEYEYTSIMKSYGGLDEWNFQEELPIIASKYNLTIIPNAEFAYRFQKSKELNPVVKPFTGGVYFEMNNLPGLTNEAYMDARKDYVQKVIFQLSGINRGGSSVSKYMTSWDEVTRELNSNSDFGGVLGKKVPGSELFILQAKAIASEPERMKQVFDYVKHNISWNHYYSRYASDGIKDAWLKKSGTSGQINLILVNLLKEAGLEAYPTLISHRSHGKVNAEYPFLDQFNSVIATVKVNGRNYYLDATELYTPPQITPNDLLNTTAFIVNRKAGGIVTISNDSLEYKESIFNRVAVSPEGDVDGETSVSSKDYARVVKLEEYQTNKADFDDRFFKYDKMDIGITALDVSNTENDSLPLQQKCNFKSHLNNSGEYNFVPLNLFSGYTKNPFVSDNRFSNINFGYKKSIDVHTVIMLPASFTVEEVPKSIKLTDPEKNFIFTRIVEYNKDTDMIEAVIKIESHKSLYEADEYPLLKEMYKRIFDLFNEPVLLKKK